MSQSTIEWNYLNKPTFFRVWQEPPYWPSRRSTWFHPNEAAVVSERTATLPHIGDFRTETTCALWLDQHQRDYVTGTRFIVRELPMTMLPEFNIVDDDRVYFERTR